jgi:hypothetical protein
METPPAKERENNMQESSVDGVKTSGEKSRQVRLHNFRI